LILLSTAFNMQRIDNNCQRQRIDNNSLNSQIAYMICLM